MASGTQVVKRKRNGFNLSHKRLSSIRMGYLYPIGVRWVNPGDIFTHKTFALLRTQPMFAPLFGKVIADITTWFVPTRLLWEDFEDFITGGPDGTSAPERPFQAVTAPTIGSLWDHLGVPPSANGLAVSVLSARAYNIIYNNKFRDPDLQTEIPTSLASGLDSTTTVGLVKACWRKDYFTSARPWPQKGPDVLLPLGDEAPVVYSHENTDPWNTRLASDGSLDTTPGDLANNVAGDVFNTGGPHDVQLDPAGNLVADLSSATAVTIRQLRLASAIQRYRENMAIAGSRYYERLAQLGVRSADARLQMPELLGRSRGVLQVSEVLQTTPGTTADDTVGALKGHGIGGVHGRGYRRHFTEHGVVMTLITVRPEAIYMDGIDRHLLYQTKEDWWQPELEAVGQQEVWKAEVFADTPTPSKETWAYQDRYDEDRRAESTVHGEFRDLLSYWHLGRAFPSLPNLNSDFVQCTPDEDRVFPAPTQDTLYLMVAHKLKARRLLSGTARRQLL